MKISAKVLSKDIKRYLLQGVSLETIKAGALAQEITEETWNLALNILLKKAKFKKRLLFFTKFLQYFLVLVFAFHLYLWWEFSHRELQMYYSYIDFIRQKPPIEAFKELQDSEKIGVVSREVKPFSDLTKLEWYVTSENKKNLKSFELFFDEKGVAQKNRVYFEKAGEMKALQIFETGAFEHETSLDFIEENLLWIRVLQNIQTDVILEAFGNSLRTVSLKLEKDEGDVLLAQLMVVYEVNGSFRSTYLFFNQIGEQLDGKGKLRTLFPKAEEKATEEKSDVVEKEAAEIIGEVEKKEVEKE